MDRMNYFVLVPADDPADRKAAGYRSNLYPSVSIAKRALRRLQRRGEEYNIDWTILRIDPNDARRHPKFKTLVKPMGAHIKDARERAGLSLRELASRMGIPHTLVWKWESGVADPTEASFYDAMETLGQWTELRSGKATPTRPTPRVYL